MTKLFNIFVSTISTLYHTHHSIFSIFKKIKTFIKNDEVLKTYGVWITKNLTKL